MIDPLDRLFDDRPLIEIGGNEMRGGTDQLDAALVRLVVRLCATEAGQETVVDIDAPPRKPIAQVC